ncbi:MAG: RNA polymerase sigma factor [Clostridiales bacterium]|jgi:RNA polymerase sigma factor (sigma-70 family)|nr:RNA polymerase sigma factor [Clostridiales bacterium]
MTEANTRVQKAIGGDAQAFAELYSIYAKDLYRFALYCLKNEKDAQDAVQDAVLLAFTKIGSLRNEAAFKSWLFKILSNCCKTRLMKSSASPVFLDISSAEHITGDDENIPASLKSELLEVLDTLSAEDREIVLLSALAGYKSHEIAEMLGCPSSTVRSRLARALKKMREQLKD